MTEERKCDSYFTEEHMHKILKGIDDGGSRQAFDTGAVREGQEGKGRYDLISPYAEHRLAVWYELGALKYSPRNWEKGLPISNCVNSLKRHMNKYLKGMKDEDHLAAIAWNCFAIMHFEEVMPELQDIPTQKEVTT